MKLISEVTKKKYLYAYSNYGCNCGFRQYGAPVDATDRCCAEHNCCYRHLRKLGCNPRKTSYSALYNPKSIKCVKRNKCKTQVCECDKVFAKCLAKSLKTYKRKYQYYEKEDCKRASPRCKEPLKLELLLLLPEFPSLAPPFQALDLDLE
ncbi:basic phospholipase A2 homolog blK-PLA2-like [Erinaceus europaeus]|uniref:Phospholipase A2 n=1 Tax=Erinaceus europaeus TaxID=9365 RepID=A0ABM3Y782_ERIEU|nr:basic phospholipase A2 homolog blK-PLA2-like [Erinaceus europaeus]